MNEKELLKLKKKIDSAESEEQRLKGERNAVLANLKEDFDCSTIDEAKKLRKKLEKQREQLQETIEQKLEEINKLYIPDESAD